MSESYDHATEHLHISFIHTSCDHGLLSCLGVCGRGDIGATASE
jgi:hypothetical protein